jgi:hypothetical protein
MKLWNSEDFVPYWLHQESKHNVIIVILLVILWNLVDMSSISPWNLVDMSSIPHINILDTLSELQWDHCPCQ